MSARVDKTRIQGFGSDGAQAKVWQCPAGHNLQPWKAQAGKCDGCGVRISAGDDVMDCRTCNWYLCSGCHPQEKDPQDWFWGSLSYIAEVVQQEVDDIQEDFKEVAQELETFMSDMGLPSCNVTDAKQFQKDEVTLDSDEEKFTKAKPKPKAKAGSKAGKHAGQVEPAEMRHASRDSAVEGTEQADRSAPVSPETAKPQQPPREPEDLLDIGQDDLLFFPGEPPAQGGANEAHGSSSSTSKVTELPVADMGLDDLLFDVPAAAPTQPVQAAPAQQGDDTFDLLFGPSTGPSAAGAPAVAAASASPMLLPPPPAPKASAAVVSAPTPLASNCAAEEGPALIDLSDAAAVST